MVSSGKRKANGSPKGKSFYWNFAFTKMFVELLLDYQRKVGRDQPFNWQTIRAQFEEATGEKCNMYTLENCNRDMKTHWGKWIALKQGETGWDWDAKKGTIDATNDWWERKIKENAYFGIFRKKGVPPELEDLWTQLYEGTVATGEYCIAPSMEASQSLLASCTGGENDGDSDEETEDDGDSETGPGPELYQQHLEMVRETNNKLLAILEKKVSARYLKSRIGEVMDVVDEMVKEGLLVEGEPIWCFTVSLMRDTEQQDIFLCIKRNDSRMKWLQWLYDKNGGRIP